jgi:uncharacterized membrane protein YGL010W
MLARLRADFAHELHFYRKFHRHPINWALHAVCVPLEWLSWLVVVVCMGVDHRLGLLGCVGGSLLAIALLGEEKAKSVPPIAVAVSVFYAVLLLAGEFSAVVVGSVVGLYYLALRPSALHAVAALAQPLMGYGALLWVEDYGFVAAVAMHLGSWFLQVGVGHSMIEGNEPGMATALTLHAIILSPLLAWLP